MVTGLALILTLFIMAPTAERMYRAAEPTLATPAAPRAASAELVTAQSAAVLAAAGDRAKEPLRDFLLRHASSRDRATFHGLALRLRTPAERPGSPTAICRWWCRPSWPPSCGGPSRSASSSSSPSWSSTW